jgi:uncharacterized coiled-coil protein SlyX
MLIVMSMSMELLTSNVWLTAVVCDDFKTEFMDMSRLFVEMASRVGPCGFGGTKTFVSICMLPLLLLLCSSTSLGMVPVMGRSFFVSTDGVSLDNSPFLLDGLDVGATLRALSMRMDTAEQKALQQERTIMDLTQRNVSLTQQVNVLQQTVQQLQTIAPQMSVLNTQMSSLLKPTAVHATAGDSNAIVHWSTLNYTVKASPGGKQCQSNGLTGEGYQACTVMGLTNGVQYQFTVQLENAAGPGPISGPSNTITPMLLCLNLTSVATGSGGGAFTFTPTNSPGCPFGSYTKGALVTASAVSGVGSGFLGWQSAADSSGVLLSDSLSYTFVVDDSSTGASASNLFPGFGQCVGLTLGVASGNGSVSASMANSPGCPLGQYADGASLTLTATAALGWGFSGWSGTHTGEVAVWSFTVPPTGAKQDAHFSKCLSLSFATSPPGQGTVIASPTRSPNCLSGGYLNGEEVTLKAVTSVGYGVVGWSGTQSAGSLQSAVWSYTMGSSNAIQTVTLGRCVALQVNSTNSTTGTVSVMPVASDGCSAGSYGEGAVITLTAVAKPGGPFVFAGWTGTQNSMAATWTYTVGSGATVASQTAVFSLCYPLTTYNGQVTRGTILAPVPANSPGCVSGQYVSGATVSITTNATSGYSLGYWLLTLPGASATQFPTSTLVFTTGTGPTNVESVFALCYTASFSFDNTRGTVQLTPDHWGQCGPDQFIAGVTVIATATPFYSNILTSWGAPLTAAGSNNVTSFVFPSSIVFISPIFQHCWSMTISTTNGGIAWANPDRSPGCPPAMYLQGTSVQFNTTAPPPNPRTVVWDQWSGWGSSTNQVWTVSVPNNDRVLLANYKVVRTHTHTHTHTYIYIYIYILQLASTGQMLEVGCVDFSWFVLIIHPVYARVMW